MKSTMHQKILNLITQEIHKLIHQALHNLENDQEQEKEEKTIRTTRVSRKKKARRRPDITIEKIKELRKQGLTGNQIAEQLNANPRLIHMRLYHAKTNLAQIDRELGKEKTRKYIAAQ